MTGGKPRPRKKRISRMVEAVVAEAKEGGVDLSDITQELAKDAEEWGWLEEGAEQESGMHPLVIESEREFEQEDKTPTDTAKQRIIQEGVRLTQGMDVLNYTMLEVLGVGSESLVMLAMNSITGDVRAMKFPHTKKYEEDSAAMSWLFQKEADSLKKLNHPNIVKVHDYQIHMGRPYLFLEPLDMMLLDSFEESPSLERLVGFMHQSADAVEYMHSKGMVHLDIKPTQFMLDEEGHLRLIDLGSVRNNWEVVSEGIPPDISPDAVIQMTPGYFLLPVMDKNKRIRWHWRTDIYALVKTYASLSLVAAGMTYKQTQKLIKEGEEMQAIQAMGRHLPDVMGQAGTTYFTDQIYSRGMRPIDGPEEFTAEMLKNNIVEFDEVYAKPYLAETKKKSKLPWNAVTGWWRRKRGRGVDK